MGRLTTPLVFLALLAAAVAVKVTDPPLVATLRLKVFDAYQQLAPRSYEPAPVRIVDIDDESLARVGQWPWPRHVLAELLDRLEAQGAAAVAFGIVFAEPDRSSPAHMLQELRRLPGFALDGQTRTLLRDNDAALAARMAELGVVAGFALTQRPSHERPAVRWGLVTVGEDVAPFLPQFAGVVPNIRPIDDATAAQGALNLLPDIDGVVRTVPLLARVGADVYPTLTAEVLRHVQGASTYVVRTSPPIGRVRIGASTGVDGIRIGALELTTTASGGSLVHFAGHRPERFVSAWTVLQGEADPALLAGHIVLVGTSAAGLGDVVATPVAAAMPGIEVHAELLEQLLLGVQLIRPDWAASAELLLLLALGGVLLFLLQRLGALAGAALGALAVGAAVGASVVGFLEYGVLLDPVLPSLTLLAIYLAATVVAYLRTESERAEVRRAFGLYLSPTLVERLAANPGQLRLGGESRELTLLFSDIRGFTGLSEAMSAEQLTRFVNRFLTPMTDAIQDHDGTIDKYMGDGIMAFWNAPLDVPDHARKACAAALDMRCRLVALNAAMAAEEGAAHRPIRIGIGLDTGPCSVGNLGSERRFSYSAIGETVNLAARFEGQSKVYGVDVLLSGRTRAAAPDMAALELDRVRVVGASRPEPLFFLMGDADLAHDDAFRALETAHRAMLQAYRAQRWDEAAAAIAACAAMRLAAPLASYYDLMARRVADLRRVPPPSDWDAVFAAERK